MLPMQRISLQLHVNATVTLVLAANCIACRA